MTKQRAFAIIHVKSEFLEAPLSGPFFNIISDMIEEKAKKLVGEGVEHTVSDIKINEDPFCPKSKEFDSLGLVSIVVTYNINTI